MNKIKQIGCETDYSKLWWQQGSVGKDLTFSVAKLFISQEKGPGPHSHSRLRWDKWPQLWLDCFCFLLSKLNELTPKLKIEQNSGRIEVILLHNFLKAGAWSNISSCINEYLMDKKKKKGRHRFPWSGKHSIIWNSMSGFHSKLASCLLLLFFFPFIVSEIIYFGPVGKWPWNCPMFFPCEICTV